MPTYDYQCTKCNHEFEAMQSMNAEPKATCEKCGGEAKRLFSAPTGIIFKGSGFYVTDYKNKSSAPKKECGASKECASCPSAAKS